jgi:hypothetical protein
MIAMISKERKGSVNGITRAILIIMNVLVIKAGYTSGHDWYWALIVTIPLLILTGGWQDRRANDKKFGRNISQESKRSS